MGCVIATILGIGGAPALANAQTLQTAALESLATPMSTADTAAPSEPGVVTGFLRDVGRLQALLVR
jgi:hypothetical protein